MESSFTHQFDYKDNEDLMSTMSQCPIMSMQGGLESLPQAQRDQIYKQYGQLLGRGMQNRQQFEEGKAEYQGASTATSSSNEDGQTVKKAKKVSQKPTLMGCPFFSKEITDPQGKNLTSGYPLKYISRVDFLFNPQNTTLKKTVLQNEADKVFLNSLPWIVKQILFLDNEVLKRLRQLGDVGHLIFVTDDTKIKGNKAYDQGLYYEALDIYEQVLAVFVWLEFKDSTMRERLFSDQELEQQRIGKEGITDEDVNYTERRIINEGDRDIETETKLSLVVTTLHNAALAYLSIFHFEEALKCIELILDNYCQDTEFYFRKAQCLYFNKSSTYEQLEEAINILEQYCLKEEVKLKQLKRFEKYEQLKDKITKEQQIKAQEQLEVVKMLMKRSQRLIESQKLKANSEQMDLEDFELYQILQIMNEKYPELVQFFRDKKTGEQDQVQLQKALNEHQYFAKVYSDIKFCMNFDPNSIHPLVLQKLKPKYLTILKHPKMQQIINLAKRDIAESLFFHASDLNQVIYNFAWQEYKEKNKHKVNKEEEKGQSKTKKVFKKASSILGNLSTYADARVIYPANVLIFVLLVIFILYMFGSSQQHIVRFISPYFRGFGDGFNSFRK